MGDEDQLGEGTAGEWTKQQGDGGVDGFVELFVSCVCVSCAAWLGLAWLGLAWLGLALLGFAYLPLLRWYISLYGRVGWVEVAGRAVLGDTAVHLSASTLGASHTPDDGILLEVFFLFHVDCKGFPLVCWF